MPRELRGGIRPGGRTARTREAVHEAVRELLDAGQRSPTLRDVAARAGVHDATLYRRWGTAENLVLDVAVTRLTEQRPVPVTGDLRADLVAWAESIAASLSGGGRLLFLEALLGARTDRVDGAGTGPPPFVEQRLAQIQAMLDAAAERGHRVPTIGTVFDTIYAPLYMRALVGYADPTAGIEKLVDQALAQAPD